MRNEFIKIIRNTFLMAGIIISILACVAYFSGAQYIFVKAVFENLFASFCLNVVLYFTGKFESEYFILEVLFNLVVSIVIIIFFGYLFGWISSTPVWVLFLMCVVVYAIYSYIRVQDDIKFINKQLKARGMKR